MTAEKSPIKSDRDNSPIKSERDSFIEADRLIKEQGTKLNHVASTSTANFEKESEMF